MNISPQRGEKESFKDYKARQKEVSKYIKQTKRGVVVFREGRIDAKGNVKGVPFNRKLSMKFKNESNPKYREN